MCGGYVFRCVASCFCCLQDKEKMKSTKLNSSPEPEEIQSMVCYARNLIEEFRRAKHYKNILFPPTFPLMDSCFVI